MSAALLSCLEILSTLFGLLQGYLAMKNRRSNWIAYIAQMACLFFFSMFSRLYGDVANNFAYLIVGVAGFYLWGREEMCVTSCRAGERVAYILIILTGGFLLFLILGRTNDALPLLDAYTTVSSFVATYYMVMRKTDTWLIWFVNDIIYMIEYASLPKPAPFLTALNLIWTVMAVASWFSWKKEEKSRGEMPKP